MRRLHFSTSKKKIRTNKRKTVTHFKNCGRKPAQTIQGVPLKKKPEVIQDEFCLMFSKGISKRMFGSC